MAEIPNVAGALAYLLGFISGLYFFWNERYQQNPFVRFHAFQSIFLSAVAIVVFVALNSISAALSLGFLWKLLALMSWLVKLAFYAVSLFLMYKALRRERFSLPFIGPLAAKLAG
jgi:uncharacterized membrane protein